MNTSEPAEAVGTVSKVHAWLSAARLPSLLLAVATILVGTTAAVPAPIDWLVALLAVVTAAALQLLCNLANDYGDAASGVDGAQRDGPQRALQAGWLGLGEIRTGMLAVGTVAVLCGLGLVFFALPPGPVARGIFVAAGAVAIAAALFYTIGRRPYGYRALGDLSVFVFFGPVGVLGACYLQSGMLSVAVLALACVNGLLTVGVLNINNVRDIDSDTAAGKTTVASLLGDRRARHYQAALVAGALAALLVWVVLSAHTVDGLSALAWVAFGAHLRAFYRADRRAAFDRLLGQLVMLIFGFSVLFAVCRLL